MTTRLLRSACVLAYLSPLLWLVLAGLRPRRHLVTGQWLGLLWPGRADFLAYAEPVWRTLLLSGLAAALAVAVSAPLAYWLALKKQNLQLSVLLLSLPSLLIPRIALVLPFFWLTDRASLVDTPLGGALVKAFLLIGLSLPLFFFQIRPSDRARAELSFLEGPLWRGVLWSWLANDPRLILGSGLVLMAVSTGEAVVTAVVLPFEWRPLPAAVAAFESAQGTNWAGIGLTVLVAIAPGLLGALLLISRRRHA